MPRTAETPTAESTSEPAPRHARRFSTQEVDHALTVLAFCDSNSGRAAKLLAAEGLPVAARTLREWARSTHAEDYIRICIQLVPYIKQARADRYRKYAARFSGSETETEEPTPHD